MLSSLHGAFLSLSLSCFELWIEIARFTLRKRKCFSFLFQRNKPRIRNFARISNKESETKTRKSETKIRESETKIPRIRNQKPRESETQNNQKLKIANQTPRSANQKPNKVTNQKPKKTTLKPNLPPPLNILLNEILWPTYPHKGSNPPTPLTIMLDEILPLTYPHIWDQIRHLLWPLCWMR